MDSLNKPQMVLIIDFVNKRINSLPDSLRRYFFNKYYPQLNYSEFRVSDIWENLIFLEFQELIEEKEDKSTKKNQSFSSNKSLWGISSVGPVG